VASSIINIARYMDYSKLEGPYNRNGWPWLAECPGYLREQPGDEHLHTTAALNWI
jgi:hypothetical protein